MGVEARTCISCRKTGNKGELVKLANTPSGVVVDYNEKLPGRGAYVCPERGCIEKGLNEKTLSRAFKQKVSPPDREKFYEELKARIEKKATALLGMSRKSGLLAQGFDSAALASRKTEGGLFVLAGDVSDNTAHKLLEAHAGGAFREVRFLDKEVLGRILGGAPVAVLFIGDTGLAEALYREIGRLNNIYRG